jgi:hypothetical protein
LWEVVLPDAVVVCFLVGKGAVCFCDEVVEEAEVCEGERILRGLGLAIGLNLGGDGLGRWLACLFRCGLFGLIFGWFEPEPPF